MLVAIVLIWILAGVASVVALWIQNRRPLSAVDRECARIDLALRRQYGARPSLFR
jgi:hypothetical protein